MKTRSPLLSMLLTKRKCFSLFVFSSITSLFLSQAALAAESTEGAKAPSWSLTDTRGNAVHSSQFSGKPLVLVFFATWCPHCQREASVLSHLNSKFSPKGAAVVGVSVFPKSGALSDDQFAKKYDANYRILVGNNSVASRFGNIDGVPTTFVINRHGRIIARTVGDVSESRLEKYLSSAF